MPSKRYRFAQLLVATSVLGLSACQTPGANLQANVYSEGQVNTRQKAEVINILAVLPAQVQADNTQNQRTAQIVGGLLGAAAGGALGGSLSHHYPLAGGTLGAAGGGAAGVAAGSLVPASVLVPGVSIAYEENGQTFNSAQVGQLCEFAPGRAIMIATGPGVTRIQPNATCPVQKKS